MPDFIAVKCCDCGVFQVAQVRKDKKFNCKMCAKKQSVIKVYTRWSRAADCRKIVQQLNMARGTAAEEFESLEQHYEKSGPGQGLVDRVELEQSKWAKHVRQDQFEDTDMGDDDIPTTTLPDWSGARTKRNRKRPRNNTSADNNGPHGAKRQSRKAAAGNGYEHEDKYQRHSNAHYDAIRPEFGARSEPQNQSHPDSNDNNIDINNKSGGYIVDDGFLTTMGGDAAFEEEVYP